MLQFLPGRSASAGLVEYTNTITRVQRLRDLQRRWNQELPALIGVHPDRALHLSEAIDDLQRFIQQVERSA